MQVQVFKVVLSPVIAEQNERRSPLECGMHLLPLDAEAGAGWGLSQPSEPWSLRPCGVWGHGKRDVGF